MPFEPVIKVLNLIADQLEEVSIERDAYLDILLRAGYSTEDARHIADDAKSDPEIRSRARLALADLRKQLVEVGVASPLQELPETLPKRDRQN
jgi:hypothetical protein